MLVTAFEQKTPGPGNTRAALTFALCALREQFQGGACLASVVSRGRWFTLFRKTAATSECSIGIPATERADGTGLASALCARYQI